MKNSLPPRFALALALSGAVLPFVLVGCSGGNGGLLNPAPTPTPVPNGTTLPNLDFRFNNGQNVLFRDGTLSPTGIVTATVLVDGTPSAPLQVPAGTYPVSGTLDATTGRFTLRTTGTGSFSVAGQLPTASADGTFTFTAANGATENGTIPRGTVVIPPPAPSGNLSGTLTYTNKSAGHNFSPTSTNLSEVSQAGGVGAGGVISPSITVVKSGTLTTLGDGTQSLDIDFSRASSALFGAGISDNFSFKLRFPAVSGQAFASGAARMFSKGDANFQGRISMGSSFSATVWELSSAKIAVTSVSNGGKTINFALTEAQFAPATGVALPSEPGKGTFTATGTITAIAP